MMVAHPTLKRWANNRCAYGAGKLVVLSTGAEKLAILNTGAGKLAVLSTGSFLLEATDCKTSGHAEGQSPAREQQHHSEDCQGHQRETGVEQHLAHRGQVQSM